MRTTDHLGKLVVLSSILLLTVATAGAATVDTTSGSMWLNEDAERTDVLDIDCEPGQASVNSVEVALNDSGSQYNETFSPELDANGTAVVTSVDIRDEIDRPGSYNTTLTCDVDGSKNTDSTTLDVNNLSITVEEPGEGLVGERLSPDSTANLGFLTPIEVTIGTTGDSPAAIQEDDISLDTLALPTQGMTFDDAGMIGTEAVDDGVGVTLTPKVTSYVDGGVQLRYGGDSVIEEMTVDTLIHPWKVRKAGGGQCQPTTGEGYATFRQSYTYCLDIGLRGGDPQQDLETISGENFEILVERKDRSGTFSEYDDVDEIDGADVLEETDVDKEDWNSELSLTNTQPFDDLSTGTYRLTLQFRYLDEANNEREYLVDSVVVDKDLTFSGWVQNSGGSGVPSTIELREGSSTNIVTASQSGYFEKDIEYETYDEATIMFDSDNGFSSSTLTMEEINLADPTNTDLDAQGTIVYDYWTDPGQAVDISGLNPVNMMAVGLGYDIEGDASLDMRYSASGISPNEAQVYECDQWNFGSEECLGSWSQVSSDLDQTRVTSWIATVDDLELYEVGDRNKDVLMNAYVVGVPAELQLRDSISLNVEEVPANGDIEASGTVVSSTGESVADAEVTIELLEDGVIQESYDTTTDSAGFFELTGQAPDEPGSYRLRVSSTKMPYDRLDESTDQRIEVFYETGMALSAPETPDIRTGETSRLQFTLQNTGQIDVSDVSVDVSGIEDRYYSLADIPDTVPADEPRTVTLVLDLPADYGSGTAGPTITLDASGQTEDGDVEASAQMLTSFSQDQDRSNTSDDENGTSDQSDSETRDNSEQDGSFSDGFVTPAGNLIQSQSDVNIALGLILIFALILAVAIKKKDGNGPSRRFGDTDRRGPRQDRIDRPKISASNGSNGTPAPTNGSKNVSNETDGGQDDVEDEETSDGSEAASDEIIETDDRTYMYDGKEFDTKEGVELYREMQD